VNLSNSDLTDANLTGAELFETILAGLDLTTVIGLETCRHAGPSIIDHRTLQRSPALPLSFLRGVGLPERLIESLPSLFGPVIQYYSCFISYSAEDQDFADRVRADLQTQGVRCWFAPYDMPIGGKILDEIDAAIKLRDKVLLIISEDSVKSNWVESEVTKALEEERKRQKTVLFPIRVDDAIMRKRRGGQQNFERATLVTFVIGKITADISVRSHDYCEISSLVPHWNPRGTHNALEPARIY